jgi:hypothetical protein
MMVADQPAQGTIKGASWILGTRSMNISGTDLNIALLPDAAADCTKSEAEASFPFVITFTPAMPGRYELGQDHFVTFVDMPSDNLIVGRGVIQIDSVSSTAVSGGLHAYDPVFGEINGRFDGPVCFTN